jgi:hypothetical protein
MPSSIATESSGAAMARLMLRVRLFIFFYKRKNVHGCEMIRGPAYCDASVYRFTGNIAHVSNLITPSSSKNAIGNMIQPL